MNNRERTLAILNYEDYDRIPIVHFGFWKETVKKWVKEGHISEEEGLDVWDNSPNEIIIAKKLGFDMNWSRTLYCNFSLNPYFDTKVVEETSDGFKKVRNGLGVIELHRGDAVSIHAEVDHLLKDRKSWEELYKHRLQPSNDRFDGETIQKLLDEEERIFPTGIHCGSLFGELRNIMGVEGVSYLYVDDEDLFDEIIETFGNLCYEQVKMILETGLKFDFAHFWEDICFKNGPLVNPNVFYEKVGPQYRRIVDLLNSYGINLVSVDCDGMIDALIPTWIDNGVNIMFPIEVGTWGASIKPWREKYGKELRGIGGMNKVVFSQDYAAVEKEIERLKPLVEIGGFIPCVDHRIAPDAKWELVQYYCERIRETFGG